MIHATWFPTHDLDLACSACGEKKEVRSVTEDEAWTAFSTFARAHETCAPKAAESSAAKLEVPQ